MSPISFKAIILLVVSTIGYIKADTQVEIKELDVPPHAQRSEDLLLSCNYDLNGLILESVQWYLNRSELFRYTVNGDPDKQTFQVLPVEIDREKSSATVLALRNLPLNATGTYRCTVNTEYPYSIAEKEKFMEVVVIPKEAPKLEGVPKDGFKSGETVNVNCTSPPSKPVSELRFEVNGKIIEDKFIIEYPPIKTEDGLYITKATLKLIHKMNLFPRGKLEVACITKIRTMEKSSPLAVVKSAAEKTGESLGIIIISVMMAIRR